jgi:hypothetical protein
MALSIDEVFRLASDAVRKMHDQHGPDYTFPFDMVWQYVPSGERIPGTSKPAQSGRLIRAGLIERTSEMTSAVSQARAGSPTRKYRFGAALVSRQAPAAAVAGTGPASAGSVAADLREMHARMEAKGYIVSRAELANFYLALAVSPLVVLSGISGTGKSLLPRHFAELTGSSFFAIPVQPQWADNTDVFGYVPTLAADRYVEGRLIPAVKEALEHPTRLVLALFDEMNLAPVEHYFSDFLSVSETRRRLGGAITTDRLPIELPVAAHSTQDDYASLRQAALPYNLRVIGTANMDETTKTFSPKVLDRAFAIEFDDPDLTAFIGGGGKGGGLELGGLAQRLIDTGNCINVQEAFAENGEMFQQVASMLTEVQEILRRGGVRFGYRTRDAILLYLHYWKKFALSSELTANAAFDFCLLQKILPKINGEGELLSRSLDDLAEWLGRDRSQEDEDVGAFSGPFVRSSDKVERMKALLETGSATYFWGA